MSQKKELEKKNLKLPLIILEILLIILLGVLLFNILKNDNKVSNVYLNALDSLESKLLNILNDREDLNKSRGSLNIKASTSNKDIESIINILNNINIVYDNEIDYKNKISLMNYKIAYNNEEVTNIDLYINKNDGYLKIDNFYDKIIRISNAFDNMWNVSNKNNYKIMIEEIFKIVKNNLKEDYFRKDESINEINYILEMNQEEFNKFINNIIDGILYDNKLLNVISYLTNNDIDSIKEIIKNYQSTRKDVLNGLKINVCFSKDREFKNVVIKTDKEMIINKVDSKSYDIKVNSKSVGNIIIDDNKYNINYKEDDLVFKLEINNKEYDIMYQKEMDSISISNKLNNGEYEMIVNINNKDINLSLNNTYVIEDLLEIKEPFDLSNYIDTSAITGDEVLNILGNIGKNKAALNLLNDLNKLMESDLFNQIILSGYGQGV